MNAAESSTKEMNLNSRETQLTLLQISLWWRTLNNNDAGLARSILANLSWQNTILFCVMRRHAVQEELPLVALCTRSILEWDGTIYNSKFRVGIGRNAILNPAPGLMLILLVVYKH